MKIDSHVLTSSIRQTGNIEVTAPDLGQGPQTYADVLKQAGGEQLRALMQPDSDRSVCAALYASPPYDLRVPSMAVSRLSLNLTAARVTGGVGGERARSYDTSRYSLFFAPGGSEMNWRKDAPSRHVNIYFRHDLFADFEHPDAPLGQAEVHNNLVVPGMRAIADQLVCELKHVGPHTQDAADCLARLLLIQVSRHLRHKRDDAKALGALTMSRLQDFVMAHLSERVRVADLALQADLSGDRFAWAIKTQTGLTPHQYVLGMRLRHADHLLRATPMTIADVAHACGFSSQQHLTNAMHRHLGVTPARLRHALQR